VKKESGDAMKEPNQPQSISERADQLEEKKMNE
jgi:hypothetical protein